MKKGEANSESELKPKTLEDKFGKDEILKIEIAQISMENLLNEIQDLAKKLDIEILKKSTKSNKMLKKRRRQLLLEISKSHE